MLTGASQPTITAAVRPGLLLLLGAAVGFACTLPLDRDPPPPGDGECADCAADAVAGPPCVIAGVTYPAGAVNSLADCQYCDPDRDDADWTDTPEGAGCPAPDAHECTDDICRGGKCVRSIRTGHCLIDDACYADQQPLGERECSICLASVSTTSAVPANGVGCDDGDASTVLDVCLGERCQGFRDFWYGGQYTSDTTIALTGVAAMPDGTTWATGHFFDTVNDVDGGMVARINRETAPSYYRDTGVLMKAVHHRLAVGEQGRAFYYAGSNAWSDANLQLTSIINGVWGVHDGGGELFYLATDEGAFVRCRTTDGSAFDCLDASPIDASVPKGRLFGALSGDEARVWGVRRDAVAAIFAHEGAPDTPTFGWTRDPPLGCSASPCGNTVGRIHDLWAVGSDDVWVVGEKGLVLHFDGTWRRVTIPLRSQPPQGAYVFRAVYADADLVVLAGDRQSSSDHEMVLLVHNRGLGLWFEPRVYENGRTSADDPHRDSWRFHDLGGPDVANLHVVGSKWNPSGVDAEGEPIAEQEGIYLVRP